MYTRLAVKIADMLSGVGIIPTCDGRTDRRANGQVLTDIQTDGRKADGHLVVPMIYWHTNTKYIDGWTGTASRGLGVVLACSLSKSDLKSDLVVFRYLDVRFFM